MKPTLSFVEAIKICFSKYVNFKGRARRSEFWWFYLLACIPGFFMNILLRWKTAKAAALQTELMSSLFDDAKTQQIMEQASSVDTTFFIGMVILCLISLAMFLPLLGAQVRRLHDVGKSGHMMWLYLACGIGGLVPLIMCIPEGQKGPNQYGDDPREDDPAPAPTMGQIPPVV